MSCLLPGLNFSINYKLYLHITETRTPPPPVYAPQGINYKLYLHITETQQSGID